MATTETTVEKGFLEKLKDSFKGVLLGLILIPVSFVVVYYASQREQSSEVLEKSLPYEQLSKAKEKKLPIFIEGNLKANPISDELYLKSGPYLVIDRSTQMYAYVNKSKTEKVNQGGQKVDKTTYYCELEWTSQPEKSFEGEGCKNENKINPPKTLSDFRTTNNPILVKNNQTFQIQGTIDYINMPTKNVTVDDLNQNLATDGRYFYLNEQCKNSPQFGCERLSYDITTYDENKTYSVFGDIDNNVIKPYKSKENNSYLVVGEGQYKEVLKALSSRDAKMTLIMFFVSVICFGLGLILVFNPFLELLEMIPIIGNFGAGVIRFFLFLFAFILMGITFLLIEYWYLVLILGIAIVVALIVINKKRSTA